MKIWAKVMTQQKIVEDTVQDFSVSRPTDIAGWSEIIVALCKPLDLARPVILQKNVNDLLRFSRTVFSASDFMESICFDKFEIEIFPEKKKETNVQYIYGA